MASLKNKIVLITGASSGIGMACAEAFARKGSKLILCARRLERLTELRTRLVKKFKVEILAFQLDVRNRAAVKKAVENLPNKWKQVDILINNAGLARGLSKLHEADTKHWEEMIDTNLKGLLNVTRYVLPLMVAKSSGHIVNIGSTAGHEVYPMGNVYCATKFAVKSLTQSIRLDVLDKDIKVTSVDPGMVLTEFSKVRFSGDESRAKKVYDGIKPLSPNNVADAILFCTTRPKNVNINEIILTPIHQASSTQIYRQNIKTK
ncbi:MAG: SDR family oxidoreductase [Ignavibacteriaceae bacterium]|nr:SDR family oxidoreductase [Ignavibacteriaceae bacterium]